MTALDISSILNSAPVQSVLGGLPPNLQQVMRNPQIAKLMQNPEIAKIIGDPEKTAKYADYPIVKEAISKFPSKDQEIVMNALDSLKTKSSNISSNIPASSTIDRWPTSTINISSSKDTHTGDSEGSRKSSKITTSGNSASNGLSDESKSHSEESAPVPTSTETEDLSEYNNYSDQFQPLTAASSSFAVVSINILLAINSLI
eukprot:NODE_51_length_27121_cov_0.309452.p9 type:complete len:202 gc:universal NODE_51_length_27121_cov_0.309452:16360-15755(-)